MIIGLHGKAGSGKSTAAKILADRSGFRVVKFAGPLKTMMRSIGLTDSHIEGPLKHEPCDLLCGRTPRHAMQTIGTEWGRNCIGESFWVDLWAREVEKFRHVVADDCRFPNEAERIRSMGGVIVKLVGRGGISGGHASESELPPHLVDHVIDNSRDDVKYLEKQLDMII